MIFKPKYHIREPLRMSPLTSIGDAFYIPTQEIIDELSDDGGFE